MQVVRQQVSLEAAEREASAAEREARDLRAAMQALARELEEVRGRGERGRREAAEYAAQLEGKVESSRERERERERGAEAESLHEEIDSLHRQLGEYEEKVKTLTGQLVQRFLRRWKFLQRRIRALGTRMRSAMLAKMCAHWAKHTALQRGLRFVRLEWYGGSRRLHSLLVSILSIWKDLLQQAILSTSKRKKSTCRLLLRCLLCTAPGIQARAHVGLGTLCDYLMELVSDV